MYFTIREFFPHCSELEINEVLKDYSKSFNLIRLYHLLSELRQLACSPILITSGYRNFSHNTRAKGSLTSQHMSMSAVDIKCSGLTPFELAAIIQEHYANQVGQLILHKTFIHLALPCSKFPQLTISYY